MKSSLFPFFLLAVFSFALPQYGCSPERGCTDPNADNYDPEAGEDDDTCIPTNLKFLGEYDARGTSREEGDTALTSYDQIALTVTNETAGDPLKLILGISNFDTEIYSLDAVIISQYRFNIPTKEIGAFTFFGSGNINGKVLEMVYTRIEEIEVAPDEFEQDTLHLSLHAIQQPEEE